MFSCLPIGHAQKTRHVARALRRQILTAVLGSAGEWKALQVFACKFETFTCVCVRVCVCACVRVLERVDRKIDVDAERMARDARENVFSGRMCSLM